MSYRKIFIQKFLLIETSKKRPSNNNDNMYL